MDTRILSIKLAQEAKQWDSMCTKLYQFLAETTEDRQKEVAKYAEAKEKELQELNNAKLVKKSTKMGESLEELQKKEEIRKKN